MIYRNSTCWNAQRNLLKMLKNKTTSQHVAEGMSTFQVN
jgi:hypothetical protein